MVHKEREICKDGIDVLTLSTTSAIANRFKQTSHNDEEFRLQKRVIDWPH